jgi:hypothetical protein
LVFDGSCKLLGELSFTVLQAHEDLFFVECESAFAFERLLDTLNVHLGSSPLFFYTLLLGGFLLHLAFKLLNHLVALLDFGGLTSGT